MKSTDNPSLGRPARAERPVRQRAAWLPETRRRRGRFGRCRLITRHVALELVEPEPRIAIGGRAPVAPWREIAPGDHLGPIRHRRALKLADLKEPVQEHP